jgi:hypothetical protein
VAITPPSDIVLDVARAADPEKYRAAAERLSRLRATAASTQTFSVPAPEASVTSANVSARPTGAILPFDSHSGAQTRRRLDAYGQFESFVLQSFIHSMLPSNASNVFGKGSAGEFWKSMLAEKMGDELARSGQIGIARRLAAGPTHPVRPTGDVSASAPATTPPPSSGAIAATQSRPPAAPDASEHVVATAANTSNRS